MVPFAGFQRSCQSRKALPSIAEGSAEAQSQLRSGQWPLCLSCTFAPIKSRESAGHTCFCLSEPQRGVLARCFDAVGSVYEGRLFSPSQLPRPGQNSAERSGPPRSTFLTDFSWPSPNHIGRVTTAFAVWVAGSHSTGYVAWPTRSRAWCDERRGVLASVYSVHSAQRRAHAPRRCVWWPCFVPCEGRKRPHGCYCRTRAPARGRLCQ